MVPPRPKVVSELGQMGHREGEALTKIDSLGQQLASLLDHHDHFMGLDDMSVFDESSGDLTFPYSSPSPTATADGASAATTVRGGDGGGDALPFGVNA
ncbi:unnamed protein product, partial [Laminaria digitata]